MAIAITNLTNTSSTSVITASGDIVVTDIVLFNTDPDASSSFEWSLNLVLSGGSVTVNNLLYDSSTPAAGYANSLVPGSHVHVNTITGFIGNKWLLSNGDQFFIQLDATGNGSAAWSGSPATVPVNVFINYIGV